MIDASSEFSRRLNLLFEFRTQSDGSAYTEGELIAAAGGDLSLRQLRRLRSGQSTNPSLRAVKAIADVHYIFVTGRQLNEPIAWGGPIVMNTRQELETAFRELDEGQFIKTR